MSEEAMLEQYPATLTEFAAPVNSDDVTMSIFRPLLAQTRLQKMPLRCEPYLHYQDALSLARNLLGCKPEGRTLHVRP